MESSPSLQMSSSSTTTTQDKQSHPQSHPSLRAVRKPPAKPWRRPDLPRPPKVYRVDPHGFRNLVQKLTGMPHESAARPAATVVAPPQLKVEQRPKAIAEMNHESSAEGMMGLLSPSFYSSWCSFPLLSPGSMAALES